MTGPRMRASSRGARARRETPICAKCNDNGFVRIKDTDEVVPCPSCNEDGSDEVTG
jgi:DnaJ-class molecular chaperone